MHNLKQVEVFLFFPRSNYFTVQMFLIHKHAERRTHVKTMVMVEQRYRGRMNEVNDVKNKV